MKFYANDSSFYYETMNIIMLNNEQYLIHSSFFTYIFNTKTNKAIDLAEIVKKYYNLSLPVFLQANFELLDEKTNKNYFYLKNCKPSLFLDPKLEDKLIDKIQYLDIFPVKYNETNSSKFKALQKVDEVNTIKNIIFACKESEKQLLGKIQNDMKKITEFIVNKLNELMCTNESDSSSKLPAFEVFGDDLSTISLDIYFNCFHMIDKPRTKLQKLMNDNIQVLESMVDKNKGRYDNDVTYKTSISSISKTIIPFSSINIKDYDFNTLEVSYVLFNLDDNKLIFPKHEHILNMYKDCLMLDSSNFIKNKEYEKGFILQENKESFDERRQNILSKLITYVKDKTYNSKKIKKEEFTSDEINFYTGYYLGKNIIPEIITPNLNNIQSIISNYTSYKKLFEAIFKYYNENNHQYINKNYEAYFNVSDTNNDIFVNISSLIKTLDTYCFITEQYKLFGVQIDNELSYNLKSALFYDDKILKYIDNTFFTSDILQFILNNKTLNLTVSLPTGTNSSRSLREKYILKPTKNKLIQNIDTNKVIYIDSNVSNTNGYFDKKMSRVSHKKTIYDIIDEHKILKEFDSKDFNI